MRVAQIARRLTAAAHMLPRLQQTQHIRRSRWQVSPPPTLAWVFGNSIKGPRTHGTTSSRCSRGQNLSKPELSNVYELAKSGMKDMFIAALVRMSVKDEMMLFDQC